MDASQCEPRPEAGGGAVPGGTPVCRRPTPRVRGGRTADVQQPQANLGAALARLHETNPSPEANASMATSGSPWPWWRSGARRPNQRHLR
jgi:hypothetical protein